MACAEADSLYGTRSKLPCLNIRYDGAYGLPSALSDVKDEETIVPIGYGQKYIDAKVFGKVGEGWLESRGCFLRKVRMVVAS